MGVRCLSHVGTEGSAVGVSADLHDKLRTVACTNGRTWDLGNRQVMGPRPPAMESIVFLDLRRWTGFPRWSILPNRGCGRRRRQVCLSWVADSVSWGGPNRRRYHAALPWPAATRDDEELVGKLAELRVGPLQISEQIAISRIITLNFLR